MTLELMDFIEQNVIPRYSAFDKAHNTEHVTNVIRRSLRLASQLGADEDMAYVVAAYHDLGLEGPRAIHHLTSGRIVAADKRLLRWFSPQQINIIKEAVEDHRASASHVPRSIYGKIVAEADRNINAETVFTRTVLYGLDHYAEFSKEEHWKRFLKHMRDKYSTNGYIKLWIPGSDNERNLAEIRKIIENPTQLRERFEQIWAEVAADKV